MTEENATRTVVGGERDRQELQMNWVREHGPEFRGMWVALFGDRLLAAGPEAVEVFRKAQGLGVEVPFVEYIDSEPRLPYAGW